MEDWKKSCDKDENSDWGERDHTEELRSLDNECIKYHIFYDIDDTSMAENI